MLRGWEVRGRGLLIALLIALAPVIAALPVPAAARAAAATYLYDGLQQTSPHAPAMQTVHSSRNTTTPSGPLVLLDRPAESAASRDAAEDGGGFFASRLRAIRADPERGSIGGQWPTPTAGNCTQCATDIQKIIGGDRAVLEPAGGAPKLGPSANDPYVGWTYHEFVVKNGMAYDGFTGRAGMKLNDFLSQFEYGSDLNFRTLP